MPTKKPHADTPRPQETGPAASDASRQKIKMKPGNMLYPLPAVLVTCGDAPENHNVLTLAWAGTVNTNPPMVSISVRPERHSHGLISRTGEFVVNLTTADMVYETDYCGVKSGRDENKFETMKLEKATADIVKAPLLKASPVNIECRVNRVIPLGSHDLFIADVVAVHADSKYMDANNRFHLNDSHLLAYSHGRYFNLGDELGSFGYSVNKKQPAKAAAKDKKKEKPEKLGTQAGKATTANRAERGPKDTHRKKKVEANKGTRTGTPNR